MPVDMPPAPPAPTVVDSGAQFTAPPPEMFNSGPTTAFSSTRMTAAKVRCQQGRVSVAGSEAWLRRSMVALKYGYSWVQEPVVEEKPRELTEKEKMAQALFGGLGAGATPSAGVGGVGVKAGFTQSAAQKPAGTAGATTWAKSTAQRSGGGGGASLLLDSEPKPAPPVTTGQ